MVQTSRIIKEHGLRRRVDQNVYLERGTCQEPRERYEGVLRMDENGFFVGNGEYYRIQDGHVIGVSIGRLKILMRPYNVVL